MGALAFRNVEVVPADIDFRRSTFEKEVRYSYHDLLGQIQLTRNYRKVYSGGFGELLVFVIIY
jgi:hypothetical protein